MATLAYCTVGSNSGERRPDMHFSYFRDLDGNKLCAYCIG